MTFIFSIIFGAFNYIIVYIQSFISLYLILAVLVLQTGWLQKHIHLYYPSASALSLQLEVEEGGWQINEEHPIQTSHKLYRQKMDV